MSEETTVYQVGNDEEANTSKFAESTVRAVAENSWWRKRSEKAVAKNCNITVNHLKELRFTYEYHKYVEQLMVGQRSLECFDRWIQRHKREDKKQGRDEMQDFAERMGINRSVVPGMIERVRQAHADIASGKMKAPPKIPNPNKKRRI